MKKDQIRKMRGCFDSILFQLDASLAKIGTTRAEQTTAEHINQAIAQLKRAAETLDFIIPTDAPHPREIYDPREYWETYNLVCRNYTEVRNKSGKIIERGCIVGMDMTFCSKNCAYATNNVCTLKAKKRGRK